MSIGLPTAPASDSTLDLNRFLHRLSEYPGVYDALQILAGRPIVAAALRRWLRGVDGTVLDVGGGTGQLKTLLPRHARHFCLDVDRRKLARYAAKFDDAVAIGGDALCLPVRSTCLERAAFVAVSHHLADDQFDVALAELARVLRPNGVLFFFDAVWVPDSRVSSFLWRRDRGAHPRTIEQLTQALQRRFRVVDPIAITAWHRYFGCHCRQL